MGLTSSPTRVQTPTPSLAELAELSDSVYENEDTRTIERMVRPEIPAQSSSSPFGSPGLLYSTPVGRPGPIANTCSINLGSRTGPILAVPEKKTIVWRRRRRWRNLLGFYAALYTRESDGINVLAFRGTDEILTDGLIDDGAIAAGHVPPQAIAAFAVARAASVGTSMYITGHSLGGALAILTAARYGAPAVTYNAPGVMDSCVEAGARFPGATGGLLAAISRCISGARVLNVRISADPVSSFFTTGLQTGRRVELSAPQCNVFNALCRHGIDTVVEQVKKRPDAFEPLKL